MRQRMRQHTAAYEPAITAAYEGTKAFEVAARTRKQKNGKKMEKKKAPVSVCVNACVVSVLRLLLPSFIEFFFFFFFFFFVPVPHVFVFYAHPARTSSIGGGKYKLSRHIQASEGTYKLRTTSFTDAAISQITSHQKEKIDSNKNKNKNKNAC
jgi:hypothetical protein